MGACCDNDGCIGKLRDRQRGTLLMVLAINAIMFVVIILAAIRSNSSALLTESLDNLGDALTYALSLFVVSRGTKAKARVSLFKGGLIFLAAASVSIQLVLKIMHPSLPLFEVMGAFGLIGLGANSLCLFLLWRHRREDINMSSVWECSRNDIFSNVSVFIAAAAVWVFKSGWPDLIVATILVVLLLRSALRVISSSWTQMHTPQNPIA